MSTLVFASMLLNSAVVTAMSQLKGSSPSHEFELTYKQISTVEVSLFNKRV